MYTLHKATPVALEMGWKSQVMDALVRKLPQSAVEAILEKGSLTTQFVIHDSKACQLSARLEFAYSWPDVQDWFIQSIESTVCSRCNVKIDSDVCITYSVNLLHLAAMHGHTWLVQRLVKLKDKLRRHKFDVNAQTAVEHFTALSCALLNCQGQMACDIVQCLLDAGASVEIRDSYNNTPLHHAAQCDSSGQVLAVLLQSGKALNDRNAAAETPLFIAVKQRSTAAVSKLIEANADCNLPNETGRTPIIHAIRNADEAMVQTLLQGNCDVDLFSTIIRGESQVRPLIFAVYQGHSGIVELLLRAGADPRKVDEYYGRNTALHAATFSNDRAITNLLIQFGSDVNQVNDHGYTVLHFAAWEGYREICQLLLEAGGHHDNRTQDKNTPLALACHGKHPEVVRLLLEHGPCDVNNTDKDLDAAIHYCSYNGDLESMQLLLERGADPDLRNSFQCTAMWNAVYMNSESVILALLHCNVSLDVASRGIDQHAHTSDITLIYSQPRSLSYVACAWGHVKILDILLMAGRGMCRAPWQWYWEQDYPELLRRGERECEMDQNFKYMMSRLRHYSANPQSLLRLCRAQIRDTLKLTLPVRIQNLEVPNTLKDFLWIRTLDDL